MRNFNPNIGKDGQFKLDLQSNPEVVVGGDNEQHDGVTHLSPDDLIELEVTDPDEYQALIAQIEKQKELEELERRAQDVEVKENAENNEIDRKKKEEDLRISIARAYKDNNYDDERDDKTGGYGHFADIARQQRKDRR